MSQVSSESSIIFGIGSPIPKPRMKGNGIFGHVPDAFDGKSLNLKEDAEKSSNGIEENGERKQNNKDNCNQNLKIVNNYEKNDTKLPNHLIKKKQTIQSKLAKKKQVSEKITFIDEEVKNKRKIFFFSLTFIFLKNIGF